MNDITTSQLMVGSLIVVIAGAAAGSSGFGFAMVATPLLLLTGFPPPFVIANSLLLTGATRLSVSIRFWSSIHRNRVLLLVLGSFPGLYLGTRVIAFLDAHALKVVVGLVVMLASASLAINAAKATLQIPSWACMIVGFAGGLLGTSTSLNGVVPALALIRSGLPTQELFADLAVYAVASACFGVILLALTAGVPRSSLMAAIVWLPLALVANAAGVAVGLRLNRRAFSFLALSFAFAMGAATVVTA